MKSMEIIVYSIEFILNFEEFHRMHSGFHRIHTPLKVNSKEFQIQYIYTQYSRIEQIWEAGQQKPKEK